MYGRPISGSPIDEFKGICESKVRLEVVGAVLENIPGFVNWIDYLAESRVILREEDHYIAYQLYDVIWPFSDRDCIAEINVNRDYTTGKFLIRIYSMEDPLVPLKANTVRLPEYAAEFSVEYIDREHTRLTYTAKLKFGGYVPVWFGNLLSREIPYRVLNGLIGEARKKEYRITAENSDLKKNIEASIARGNLKQ